MMLQDSAKIASRPASGKFFYRGTADITHSESVMLDAFRAFAALVVFVSHWDSSIVTGDATKQHLLEGLGFPGVLIFFVLSGYVISWISETRETTARAYFVARASRLYSGVVPILLFLICLELASPLYASHSVSLGYAPLTQIAASLIFANKWWFANIAPFSDAPYWSLSFEAAYYALWGIAIYARRGRWPLLILAALVVGPKILLFMPLWLSGALLHRSRLKLTPIGALAALPLALILIAIGRYHPVLSEVPWEYTASFPSHWIRALGVCVGLACALAFSPFGRMEGAIRWVAERSFVLYLLHYPILKYLALAAGDMRQDLAGRLLIGLLTLAICLLAASYIEPTKKWWRRRFQALIGPLNAKCRPLQKANGSDVSGASQ